MNQELLRIRNSIKNKRNKFHFPSKKNNLLFTNNPWLPKMISRLLITIVLTLGFLIAFKISPTFKDDFYTVVYEKNFSFASFNKLYNDWFGDILPFGKNDNDDELVFNEKLQFKSIADYKDGAKLEVSNNYLVPVLEEGLVLFVGTKEDYNNCAIVQGASGIELWYCNVNNLNVKLYDYVEKGTLLGEVNDNTLYLIYKKNGEVLDYQDYIE